MFRCINELVCWLTFIDKQIRSRDEQLSLSVPPVVVTEHGYRNHEFSNHKYRFFLSNWTHFQTFYVTFYSSINPLWTQQEFGPFMIQLIQSSLYCILNIILQSYWYWFVYVVCSYIHFYYAENPDIFFTHTFLLPQITSLSYVFGHSTGNRKLLTSISVFMCEGVQYMLIYLQSRLRNISNHNGLQASNTTF